MRKTLTLLLVTTVVLAGCGRIRDSRVNPFNWFGRAESRAVASADANNPLIPRRSMLAARERPDLRAPIDRVTELVAEQVPGGAIVRATGVSTYQGAYQVGLVPVTDEQLPEGVARFRMVAEQRVGIQGPEQSRTITAAVSLTDQDLAGVSRIEVQAARNVLTIRR